MPGRSTRGDVIVNLFGPSSTRLTLEWSAPLSPLHGPPPGGPSAAMCIILLTAARPPPCGSPDIRHTGRDGWPARRRAMAGKSRDQRSSDCPGITGRPIASNSHFRSTRSTTVISRARPGDRKRHGGAKTPHIGWDSRRYRSPGQAREMMKLDVRRQNQNCCRFAILTPGSL